MVASNACFALSALIAFARNILEDICNYDSYCNANCIGLGSAHGLSDALLLNSCLFSISAVLGGAVFGDHASPISDTTILSSTGASCPHLEHVKHNYLML